MRDPRGSRYRSIVVGERFKPRNSGIESRALFGEVTAKTCIDDRGKLHKIVNGDKSQDEAPSPPDLNSSSYPSTYS
jgi:hypothetical protein